MSLPTPPQRSDGQEVFANRGDAFMAALPAFEARMEAIDTNANSKAAAAAASAVTASAKALEASASAAMAVGATGAAVWVSGTTYAFGDVRWSPVNGLVYRRMVAGAGAMDPSDDSAAWAPLSPVVNEVDTPTNISPAPGTTSLTDKQPTLTGGAFGSLYGATHAASQWQLSTSADFSAPSYASADQAAATSFVLPSVAVAVSTTYYWRVRYKNSSGTYSAWSLPTSFSTAPAFVSYIATPAATPAGFGDAFEGGFYAGLIWNELVQSASSVIVGTGSKAFSVPDMTNAPLVYVGQSLQVRSRTNPANKMVGVVTMAAGTVLTINVTGVGAGTGSAFSDWSVMAQYRVIASPRASGENLSIALKNATTAFPVACLTLSEGAKATAAMVAADTATVYPAAWWCKSLNIGGRTDWYLPARDELELCYRNLKPFTNANYITVDRPLSASSYLGLGSPNDTSASNGYNLSSSPEFYGNTSGTPAQVAAGKNFRTGESEAFGTAYVYRGSTEYSATQGWIQYFDPGFPGRQHLISKTNAGAIRAVRRSLI